MTPEGFRRLEDEARALGFPTVYSGVFVRSSFNAEEVFHGGSPSLTPDRSGGRAWPCCPASSSFFSFPKFGHGAVAWVALAPLLVALHGARAGRASASAT